MLLDFEATIQGLGYAGVFVASLVGSAIPFLPAPYLVPVVLTISELGLNPVPVVSLSAVGASIGKMVIFVGSRTSRKLMSVETKARMEPLQRFLQRRGWIAIFFAAATPVPDDVVYIPVAIGGYDIFRFFIFVFTGKLLLTSIVAYLAVAIQELFQRLMSGSFLEFAIFFAVLYLIVVLLVSYLMTRVDWRKIFRGEVSARNS